MFQQIDATGKTFDLLMLIVCVGLLGGSVWLDFFAPGHKTHLTRWTLSFYFSIGVAACIFARNLLTDDVTGRWFLRRRKRQ